MGVKALWEAQYGVRMKTGAGWGVAALCFLLGAPTVEAQRVESPAEVVGLDTLQVVGSRLVGRSAQDSPVPVDIIQGEELQTYGIRDMDALLSATVPVL